MIEELFSKRKTTKKVIILKKYMDVRLNTIERNLQGNNTIEYLEYISRELSDLILIEVEIFIRKYGIRARRLIYDEDCLEEVVKEYIKTHSIF